MERDGFSLGQIQNWMQSILLKDVAAVDSIAANTTVDDIVHCSKRLNAIGHLDIYRHSYIARLRACMQNQFSALAYALGNDLFELFADQYLAAHPSDSYTLNTLGEKFPSFLEETRPDASDEQKETWPDFMIELARFEYSLSVIFDQNENDDNHLSEGIPDEMLKLTSVFHLFHHRFPICDYYLNFSQQNKPELPFPEESFCVVTRLKYRLGLFNIKKAQYYFLASMQQGKSVEEAKHDLIQRFNFDKIELDNVWLEWRLSFIASGFFCT